LYCGAECELFIDIKIMNKQKTPTVIPTASCANCENSFNLESTVFTEQYGILCESCRYQYHNCGHCDLLISIEESLCEDCFRIEQGEVVSYREENTATHIYQNTENGRIIKSNIGFGVEIELLAKDKGNAISLIEELPSHFGIGQDLSIKGKGYGLEVKTPVLRGEIGEQAIITATKIARKYASVNHSCGLHIHLDVSNDWRTVKKLFSFYFVFDDILTAMLPKYRRGNDYAKSFKNNWDIESILDIQSEKDLHRVWYKETDSEVIQIYRNEYRHKTRYYGTNLHNVLRANKPLEIRYHSPTLSHTKILNWVSLHQKIIEVVAEKVDMRLLKKTSNMIFFDDKLTEFFKILKLDENLKNYVKSRIVLFNPNKSQICAE